MNIDGNTQIIGFIGSTYKTSIMYPMYNAAFKALNLNYIYLPFVVNNLKKAVEGIRNLGIKGTGVTIPYKIKIIKFLDELDKNALRIGAVNVVLNKNGKLVGGNTDGLGALKALKESTTIKGKRIILMGAGGAARAIAFALKDEGGDLIIANRTEKTGQELAKTVGCQFIQLNQVNKKVIKADILINATVVGMNPKENALPVENEFITSSLVVLDLVTNPKETKLLKEAKEKRCKIIYGERMLLWQAVIKFKLFTGIDAPIKEMERILYD